MDSGPPAIDNALMAGRLDEMAALLELADANPYSARAYRRAAELVRAAPVPVAPLVRQGRVRELRGIGRGIEARLRELVETGEIAELAELRRSTPLELVALGRLLGFGAQRAIEIGAALGISTAGELRQAARDGRLREVPGIGPKREEKDPRRARSGARSSAPRHPASARPALTGAIAAALGGHAAGDARRWVDEPTRLAVVVASDDPPAARERFAALPEIVALLDAATGITADGIPIELVIAPHEALGTALVRATGPAEHLDALGPLPTAADEASLYARLGLAVPPPEIRDGTLERRPPALVEVADVRGDLHVHTQWSDGRATVMEMGIAARARGYEYLAICDHTPNVGVVPGLDGDALRRQGEEIAAANERLAPFTILRGVECDIRDDGSLDAPDDVLAELDWVQLSLHRGQRAPRRELTARVTEAMRHPAVRCLSHPTGRLIGHRPENALDLERTVAVALETGVALEVNGLPNRLDLSGATCASPSRPACRSSARATRTPRAASTPSSSPCTPRAAAAPRPGTCSTRARCLPGLLARE